MRLNSEVNGGGGGTVSVREMLFGDKEMLALLPHKKYDLICASDVLLFTSAHVALDSTLRSLSDKDTVVLIEHTDRETGKGNDYPIDLMSFFKVLEAGGLWTPSIIRDHGRHLTVRMVWMKEGDAPFTVGDMAARASSSSW